MSLMLSLKCLECGQDYGAGEKLFKCRKCNGQLQVLCGCQEASETLKMLNLIPARLKDFEKMFLSG